MNTEEWIALDFGKIRMPEKHVRNGMSVNVFPSPYNVPVGIRLNEGDSSGFRGVEVKYLSDEPIREAALAEHSRIFYGKHSHRIYKVEVPSGQSELTELLGKFQKAINSYVAMYKSSGDVERNAKLCALAIRRLIGDRATHS